MSPQPKRNKKSVERELVFDTKKALKGGKRRYVDDPDDIKQNEYLTAEEVEALGSPDAITVTITPA